MPTLLELRHKRNSLVAEARALLDRAKADGRDLNAEETTSYDKLMTDQESLRSNIEREERQEKLDREMAESQRQAPRQNPASIEDPEKRAKAEYRAAFNSWLALGKDRVLSLEEQRSLSAVSGAAGGYLLAPQEMASGIIKFLDDEVFVRTYGTKYQVMNSDSLGAASLDNDPADPDWTAEITSVSEDTTMSFGKRELRPQLVSKLLKVSNRLMRNAAQGAESIVAQRLTYKVGIVHEKGFLTGNGAGQPLGLFTASSDGISTSRDVSTGNATNAVTFNGLIAAKYGVKGQYQKRARWIFHRDGVKQIAQLRDDSGASAGTGQYLWQPSKVANEPDTLLGSPIHMSEYAPNTFTTGLYVGIYGDLSFYWIADNLQIQIQRLDELYAANNQTGFIVRAESDGMPVLGEAFARVKLA